MELFVAFRYMRGKRKGRFISAVSASAVFLGTFVLIIALSVANGFEKEVRDRIVGTLSHGKILKYHNRQIINYDSLRLEILKHPDVVSASPYISGQAGVEHDQIQQGVMLMGIVDSLEATVSNLSSKIKFGKYSLDSMESVKGRKLPSILIGIGLADKMGVRQGSEVVLISLAPVDGQIDPTPRMVRFVVSGIFETGMYEYDLNLVYVSLSSAQWLFNVSGAEGINIRTSDMFNADKISKSVAQLIGGYPYRASDWKSQNKSLFQWMQLEKLIIILVLSLIMLVAAFNIISSLIMMVYEKRREIGILMSMGTTSGSIMRIFIINGFVIGFIGSTLGTVLGVLVCYIQARWQLIPLPGDIYFINTLPVVIEPMHVILDYIMANVICLSASIWPAWHASKMLPVESIRYE